MKLRKLDLIFNYFSLLTVVFFTLPLMVFSQNGFIQEVDNIKLELRGDANSQMNKIISCKHDEIIYFVTQNPKFSKYNSRYIYTLNPLTNKLDSISILLDKKYRSLLNERFFSFKVNKEFIVILTDPYIITLSNKIGKAKLVNVCRNTKFFHKIECFDENNFYLYVNYNFHPLDAPDKHVWAKFNVIENTISNSTKMDNSNALFSHFVNDWFTSYKGLIAYASTFDYKIRLYDSKFNLYDSLNSNELEPTKIEFEKTGIKEFNSKNDISNFMSTDEKHFKRIQKIFLLDSTHLLVMIKLPNSGNGKFDVWEKNEHEWKLIKTDIFQNFFINGSGYNEFNQPIDGFFGNVNSIIYSGNNTFEIIYFPYLNKIITDNFSYKSDYENILNQQVRDNKLYYGVKKYYINTK